MVRRCACFVLLSLLSSACGEQGAPAVTEPPPDPPAVAVVATIPPAVAADPTEPPAAPPTSIATDPTEPPPAAPTSTAAPIPTEPPSIAAAATPTRLPTATTAPPTRPPAPTSTPARIVGIPDRRDIGVPLPLSARLFGGNAYVPEGSWLDLQNARFGDEIVIEVDGYYPNSYDGESPIVLGPGEGIASVVYEITDPTGFTYSHQENHAQYCAFGGDGPCNVWRFAQNGCRWPESDHLLTEGEHSVAITLNATDGNAETWFFALQVTLPDSSPCKGLGG